VARLARFAWTVLALNVAVILWGAYVRASGSGAGCGAHWPLCNGDVIPREPALATLIEYSHRLTSGVALLAVVALLVWTFRVCRRGHPARAGAAAAMVFMLTEAAVGAGLVLFQLVADNASMARAMFMAVHLLNTFLLLACISLTAWWLSGFAPVRLAGRLPAVAVVAGGVVAMLLVGASGAVAALGDTLFPSSTLGEALTADLSPASHLLIRLRVLHPLLAALTAAALVLGAPRLARGHGAAAAKLARVVAAAAGLQIAVGVANVALLAPVWIQMVHLLMADVVWIAFVLLSAQVLAVQPATAPSPAHQPFVAAGTRAS
jgi:heme A synthase